MSGEVAAPAPLEGAGRARRAGSLGRTLPPSNGRNVPAPLDGAGYDGRERRRGRAGGLARVSQGDDDGRRVGGWEGRGRDDARVASMQVRAVGGSFPFDLRSQVLYNNEATAAATAHRLQTGHPVSALRGGSRAFHLIFARAQAALLLSLPLPAAARVIRNLYLRWVCRPSRALGRAGLIPDACLSHAFVTLSLTGVRGQLGCSSRVPCGSVCDWLVGNPLLAT